MNPLPTTADSAELLAHVAWVQRLAHALVRDAGVAEDLAQETLRVGLESPPDATAQGPRLRGWLARVARRLVIDWARADGRRKEREASASRAAASRSESPLDVVERSARQQRVVAAVMALEEPFRSTVLLRFFDELPTKEIAARTNATEDLVRKRIERALARLRAQLDREFGEATERWAGALLAIPGAAVMAMKAKLLAAAAVLLLIGGGAWQWTRARAELPRDGGGGVAVAAVEADAGDATDGGDAGAAAALQPVRAALDVVAAPRPPRHVAVEVVTPDGAPCREGLLTAFWRRTPSPTVDELNTLLSHANHSLMTPRTEPLRTVERPIAGEQTELDFPSDLAELQIGASVAGRRPSLRVVLSDRATPGWGRVRLVVDEPPPAVRFSGAISVDGERLVPLGLTIAVGTKFSLPLPFHVRIDALAATYEIEPRPEGDFHLWITSDETVPCRVDVGASEAGRDLDLEAGSRLELTLVDVARSEPLPGVELLVKVGIMVITRWGDSPWHLQGEHTVAVRSDGEGRAIVATLPRTPPSSDAKARGDRAGTVEVRLDRHPIAADPLWKATLAATRADPLQATLRLDLGRPLRRIHGSAPLACRGARFDGDPPCTIAMARREADGSARREEKAATIDGEGRFAVEVPPATHWWFWAERDKQRMSEVAEIDVVADDVGPIELAPRRGSEVTLRVRGAAPPDTLLLWVEDRGSPVEAEECYLDVTAAAFERRLLLDGPTALTINRLSRSSARDREQRLTIDPATQSVVEVAFAAPTALRRIEFTLQGAKVPRPDPSMSFMPIEPPAGPFDPPPAGILLDAAGRGFHPVSLAPGRYLWTLESRLHGVVAGIVDVAAAEPDAPLRVECEVEPAEADALASGFVIEGFGEVDVLAQWSRMLSWRPNEGIDDGTPVYVPVDATVALRRPGRPVVVTLEDAALPDGALLRLMPLEGHAPFAFELQRVALDANGRAELPVAVTPGRWFWCVAGPKRSASGELGGVLGGVVEVAAGAGGEALALHAVIEQRTGAEGRSGYEITSIAGVALPREVGPFWIPIPPQFEGEAPFLAPAGAVTKPLEASMFKR